MSERAFKARVVERILEGRPEEALETLSAHYQVEVPGLRVGAVRGRGRNALAVYVARERTIYAVRREVLYDPFVILHEYYHHLRTRAAGHRGTERYADRFAEEYLEAYRRGVRGEGDPAAGG